MRGGVSITFGFLALLDFFGKRETIRKAPSFYLLDPIKKKG